MKRTCVAVSLVTVLMAACSGDDGGDTPSAGATPASIVQGVNPAVADVAAALCECWMADYASEMDCLASGDGEATTLYGEVLEADGLACLESAITAGGAGALAVYGCINDALAAQAACIRAAACDELALQECFDREFGSDCLDLWTEAEADAFEQAEEMCPE